MRAVLIPSSRCSHSRADTAAVSIMKLSASSSADEARRTSGRRPRRAAMLALRRSPARSGRARPATSTRIRRAARRAQRPAIRRRPRRQRGPLPFTGFDVIAMAAVALAVTGLGLALQRAVSRESTDGSSAQEPLARAARRLRAARPRLRKRFAPARRRRASAPWPSAPGVSISVGRLSKRGSERNTASPRSPISPSPRFAWRSRLPPSGIFESLTCRQRSRSSPTLASNSSSTVVERLGGADLEARGEQVAAVEADADPLRRRRAARPARRARRSRAPAGPAVPAVFSSSTGQRSESASAVGDRLRRPLHRGRVRLALARPGVQDDAVGADPVADPQRVGERGDRLRADLALLARAVDQVDRVDRPPTRSVSANASRKAAKSASA